MISEQSIELISPLVPWMECGICDISINKELAGIKYKKLDSLSSFLLGQSQINSLSYRASSSWKLDLDSKDNLPTKTIDNFFRSEEEWPIVFQKYENFIALDILEFNTLTHWIKTNSKVRYLYIPVSLSPEHDNDSGHACSLIIDNGLNEIYFFDPNGESNYFGPNSQNQIDRLLQEYFKELEVKCSLGYSYIPCTQTKYYTLNRDFSFSPIANAGNCMILSILFPHYLALTQCEINTGIAQLGELDDPELLELINGYSIGICRQVLSS